MQGKPIMGRVPVRIQAWLPDGIQFDVRGWLDEFKVDNEFMPVAFGPIQHHEPTGYKDYSMKAHNSTQEPRWKFHRGKPKVEDGESSQ